MSTTEYKISCSGIAPQIYPTNTVYGLLWYNENEALEIPKQYPYSGEWGELVSNIISIKEYISFPFKLSILWMSIIENRFYKYEKELPLNKIIKLWSKDNIQSNNINKSIYSHIIVGMAPLGGISIWLYGLKKSVLILWDKAELYQITNETIKLPPIENCINASKAYLSNNNINLKHTILQPNTYDKYMQQFTYRYLLLFNKWDRNEGKWMKYEDEEFNPEFENIEESLFDGTHDKLHDEGLQNYHEAGKPKKLAINWHIKKSEYTAYIWFEDEKTCSIFERFYGAHPDTTIDFIIRIDAEKKKYELALFRQGLKEPQIIPEDAYQLLVFKNKFEDYRSENYNQERGAWIW